VSEQRASDRSEETEPIHVEGEDEAAERPSDDLSLADTKALEGLSLLGLRAQRERRETPQGKRARHLLTSLLAHLALPDVD
jgi:hypothetical protein